MSGKSTRWWLTGLSRVALFAAIVLGSGNGEVVAQAVLDICGCAGDPTLTDFDASKPATYPPGTSGCSSDCTSGTITFTLPADGVLKFKSFKAVGGFYIRFAGHAANPPVTILVAGDVELRSTFGCCYYLDVSGSDGSHGGNGFAGIGGMGGPGGFRGGDGASEPVNLATVGGAGSGPGGGSGATASAISTGGTFIGVPELLPLVGGSGGGGGTSTGTSTNCTGGGGGGGAGAILIAANGTLTISNYQLYAVGGSGGSVGNGNCARGGSGGSGGAIRLVANRFAHGGTAQLFAYGGGVSFTGNAGTPGRIRLEAVDISAQTAFTPNPLALRITGPSPVSNAVAPTVNITHVNGDPVPVPPQGFRGAIDLTLPAPGVTSIDVATSGVPSGTTVEIKVKPRLGAPLPASVVPLQPANCNPQGQCTATTTFNLSAGAYLVEARATFQVQ
jgi:hypothetical protein